VLTFHGVPDVKHPWVNTDPAVFRRYMKYLKDNKYTVVAMRDLAKFADPTKGPSDPLTPIEQRVRLQPAELRCEYVVDPPAVDTPKPRLSWVLQSLARGQVQTAYRILVAIDPGNAAADRLHDGRRGCRGAV